MENYEEYVFVRCWNNPQDFLENEWEGYMIPNAGKGFNEVSLKFFIVPNMGCPPMSYDYYKSSFGTDRNAMMWVLDNYYKELHLGIGKTFINYSDLRVLRRKFESYLLDLDETKIISLINTKIDGISLMSIIYAMGLKDTSIFKNFKISSEKMNNCPVSKLLDTVF